MSELKYKKGIAEAMARDILEARRRILRRATPEETWELMRLADDLQSAGQADHLEALADRFESGAHHVGLHLEIDDPKEAQSVADDMADGLRQLKMHAAELVGEPITEERLRSAEQICHKHGAELNLLNRTLPSAENFLN